MPLLLMNWVQTVLKERVMSQKKIFPMVCGDIMAVPSKLCIEKLLIYG